MMELFKKHARYELLYPEDIFDDLLVGQGQYSLLDLEDILAESVDSIVLFPESPGSFAELGAFASNKRLANKLICVCQHKYEKRKSFINYGPIRLIKASDTGKVFNIVYDNLASDIIKDKIYKKINSAITAIKKKNPIKRNVANIMETENFVLPCIYLIELVPAWELYRLVELATGQEKRSSEIATKASISRLIESHHINRTPKGYTVTKQGINRIKRTLRATYLDVVRMELINTQYRKNKMIKGANF